jgi:DNA-binding transcriptional regulator YbjK
VAPLDEQRTTRDRILHATLRLIGEHGVAAVSNRRVASAAGVALGSLTYHFPSQTELLRESLLLHVHEEVKRLTAIAAELRRSTHSVTEVAAAVEQIVGRRSNRLNQLAELELHLHAARDRELQDASRRCFAAYEDFAAAALESLSVPDPAKHAQAVVALMTGLAVRRLGTGRHDAAGTAEALMTIVNGSGAISLDI